MNNRDSNAEDILAQAASLRWELGEKVHETLMESIFEEAAGIANDVVSHTGQKAKVWDRSLDWLFTSRLTGFPIMFALLAGVLWLTITGANVPSSWLAWVLLDTVHPLLKQGAAFIHMPWWLAGVLIDGMYMATAWVVSVMLPPMAIFFPLFTLCEDFGYLPRVAFNMDALFKKVGAHGKQALTMSMGYGCNAAGIVACRIIDSPRERLIAIITNNFAVCNGRWPTLFLISSIFIGGMVSSPLLGSLVSSGTVLAVMMLGVLFTFGVSWLLSNTMLRGEASIYSLELPPYRPPRFWRTMYTSLIDRTIYVLWRAIVFALPAGAVIWLLSNVTMGGETLAVHIIHWLNPFGVLIGLNGVILLAYIIAIPANEIVIPTVLMLTVLTTGTAGVGAGNGVMFELSEGDTAALLHAGGWTLLTAVNLLLFCLLHNPCSTTVFTIWKETRNLKWTTVAALLPLVMGLLTCFFVAQVWRLVAGGVTP